jgi:hypothetical protein
LIRTRVYTAPICEHCGKQSIYILDNPTMEVTEVPDPELKPTEKPTGIEELLTELGGISRQDAYAQGVCTWCKKPLTEFRDELSKREYRISGFCQSCQDETFGTGDGEEGTEDPDAELKTDDNPDGTTTYHTLGH